MSLMERLMTDPRILPLEGVENFRDYGGYAVGGGRVASGQLFRAAHQARDQDALPERAEDHGGLEARDPG